MKILKLSVLIFTFLLLSFSLSNAQELLVTADEVCSQGPPGSSGAVLYRVNPDTAESEEIGSVGFDGVGALAQIGDGRLIAGARGQGGGGLFTSLLIEINPRTGQGTLIGVSGSSTGPGCGRINDLTYDPMTDTLYGTGIRCDDENNDFDVRLLSIDPDTGAQTIIGETGFRQSGNALAIDSAGALFSSGCCTDGEQFYSIDPNTGVATLLATIPQGTPTDLFNSFVFNPFNGQLLGTNNDFESTDLANVDPFTGNFTILGSLPDCADGMEFFIPLPSNVPTLSEWGLISMAAILGIVGFMVIRRRKLTA